MGALGRLSTPGSWWRPRFQVTVGTRAWTLEPRGFFRGGLRAVDEAGNEAMVLQPRGGSLRVWWQDGLEQSCRRTGFLRQRYVFTDASGDLAEFVFGARTASLRILRPGLDLDRLAVASAGLLVVVLMARSATL